MKRAIVIGASSGIGRGLAKILADNGYKIGITGRRLNLLNELEKSTIDTNMLGFTLIADWTFNYFQNQKSGHLVAITSVAGLRGWRDTPAYSAS